jgi:hypothetical protein
MAKARVVSEEKRLADRLKDFGTISMLDFRTCVVEQGMNHTQGVLGTLEFKIIIHDIICNRYR